MSTHSTSRQIVVGFDGSASGTAALGWALTEAARRSCAVRAIVAVPPLYTPPPLTGLVAAMPDEMGRLVGEEALATARELHPDVEVETSVVFGGTAGVLVDASHEAQLVVVGRGRHRAIGEAFTGSISTQVIAHAHCPVVVVGADQVYGDDGPVVVGVDGSAEGQAALAYAFDVADLRRAPLVVVHAWWVDYYAEAIGQAGLDDAAVARIEEREGTVLTDAMAAWTAKYPDVDVRTVLARQLPVEAILDNAKEARLVVVGSRGLGGFAGLVLGSVSKGLLHHARSCPLAVVHTS